MPDQLNTLSQSSLQDYHDCPRRFELRYLQRLAYPAIETEPALENEKHQQEGEYFHRLVQQHLIGIPAEQIGKLANTDNLQRWWENYLNAKDLSSFTHRRLRRPDRSTHGRLPSPRRLENFVSLQNMI